MIELISLAIVCLAWGYYFGVKHAYDAIKNKNEVQKKVSVAKEHIYYVEKHDETFYMYNSFNDFVCQGKTLEELIDNAKKYKNIVLSVHHDKGKFWLYNKEKVKIT